MLRLTALLTLAGALLAAPAVQASPWTYLFGFALDGAKSAGAGNPDGTGSGAVLLDPDNGKIRWDFSFANFDPITAAHIHNALSDATGPVVFPFEPVDTGIGSIDITLANNIVSNPSQYYVNFHNAAFPPGAVRDQLGQPQRVTQHVPDSLGGIWAASALAVALVMGRRLRRSA